MPINKIPQRAFSNDDMLVDNYTATAGQTAFTLTRAAAVNSVLVHVNDVIQQPTVDYTVAGTTLTMTTALSANDDVRIRIMTERPLGTQSGGSGATTLGALNDVSAATPATGQVLKWSGTTWAPAADATGGSGGGGAFTSTTDGASLTSTTAGSAAGPEVELHRDITGADGNYIGQLKFTADNDADQKNVFAKITGKIGDASDGTEDGVMEFAVKKAGSNNINVRMTSTKFRLINGTELEVAGMTYPSTDGTSGQFLRTDGAGNLSFASIGSGGSGGIALTDLSVASEGTASGDGSLAYNNTNGQFTYTPPTLNGLTNAGDVDFGSNKILYANVYANLSDLPSASSYHGMFAHVHGTGKAYYAHAGNWVPLADESQLTLDGLTGVSTSGVTSGQVLKYNGTSWAPAADSAGSGGIALGDLSIGAEGTASGDGGLAYNNSTGVFTYTPPVIPAVALPPEQVFGVTASGASAYTFTGAATGNNPTLNLNRGKTYRFDVNASGHPFQIRVSSGGSNYTDGVENAGTQSGSVYFTVPDDAPATLVYQCTVHSAMVGTINVKGYAFGDFSSGLTTSHQDFHIRGNGIYVGNDADPAIIHAGTDITLSADTSLNFVSDANDTDGDAAAGNITFGSGSYVNTDSNKDFTFDQYTNSANPTDGYTPRNVFGKFDGLGRFTLPAQPGFTAQLSANYTRAGDNTQLDPSWTVKHNVGSHFNSTSSRFTAPVGGRYLISFNITHTYSGTTSIGDAWSVLPQVNSSDYTNYQGYYGDGGLESGKEGTHNWSGVITLAANDVVQLVTKGTTQSGIVFMTGSTWTMQLIA